MVQVVSVAAIAWHRFAGTDSAAAAERFADERGPSGIPAGICLGSERLVALDSRRKDSPGDTPYIRKSAPRGHRPRTGKRAGVRGCECRRADVGTASAWF